MDAGIDELAQADAMMEDTGEKPSSASQPEQWIKYEEIQA